MDLTEDQVSQMVPDSEILVQNSQRFPDGIQLRIQSVEKIRKDLSAIITKDFTRLIAAVFIPIRKGASRSKLLSLSFLYALLIPSGVGVFFIRGWRFEIVKRMIRNQPGQPIAPGVGTLDELGIFIRDGVRLFGAKALYDLPKLVILVAIGYDHIEMIIDFIFYFFGRVPGFGDSSQSFASFAESSGMKFSTTVMIQILFFMISSFIITPAFKITMMKYANGKISYRRFFNVEEIKDSFRIYRKYKTRTIAAYLWDAAVTGLTGIIGVFLMILFPFIIWFAIPMYKLLFKHWSKAYGYGMLARRLAANGEI